MLNFLLIGFGKMLSQLIQIFNLGNGSTWPGHIALKINRGFIREMFKGSSVKIILIAGTNGKTTTASLIRKALEDQGKRVMHNESGANLLNGISSALIQYCTLVEKLNYDYAIFEIDENALPLVLKEIVPDYILLLNLFRDQLDRYGEVRTISKKWIDSLRKVGAQTKLIINADDPEIANIANAVRSKALFFSFNDLGSKNRTLGHAVDSIYCPRCGNKLDYTWVAYSHLGDWLCRSCGLKRPKADIGSFSVYPLPGDYNVYNVHGAALLLRQVGLRDSEIESSFRDFKPAFGRQEIIDYMGKKVQIFLSKNPTSFNQSYEAIRNMNAKNILLVLNDRVPDGMDVSWIWDVDLAGIDSFKNIFIAGDRVYDMALRLKYETHDQNSKLKNQNSRIKTFDKLEDAISEGVRKTNKVEKLYVLPTYSAMLEVRKILTGKKIL
jgi:UDP-N-acetylmuramyl tripeptide synthase